MTKLVLRQRRVRRKGATAAGPDPDRSTVACLGGGAALALVGWTDAALLWYPLDFGTPEWEFATTSTFFDALPLGTIGLTALAIAAIFRGSSRLLRALSVLLPVLAALFVLVLGLFLLNAVVAWNQVDPALRVMLDRAVLKTSVLGLTYIVLYAWMGWLVQRRAPKLIPGG